MVRASVAGAACVLVMSGCASPQHTTAPATTTSTSKPFDAAVFCAAVRALSDNGPEPFDRDAAGAHARVNALSASVPSDLKNEIPQIVEEYNALIDAYAANDFDPVAVLAHGSDGVRATLARLAREAQGDEGLEPEAALLYQASHICRPSDTESWYSRQGAPRN